MIHGRLLAVALSVYMLASLRESSQNVVGSDTGSRKARANALAELLKTPLFRQENKTVPQTQDCERRAYSQPEVLAKLLWDRELALFADLGGRHVLDRRIMRRHSW
jgi:hypothetical protein